MAFFTVPDPSNRWWALGFERSSKIFAGVASIVILAAVLKGSSVGTISAQISLIKEKP
jgi:hypothetical protein